MNSTRTVAWTVLVIMVAAIAYGFASGGFGDDASAMWALPWGRVALIDLYAGFLIFGAWIAYRETSVVRTALWWVALVTLGNLTAGAYLAWAAFKSRNTTELLVGESRVR